MGANVLICGAGVAGSTLAYWLARHGFEVTVVERAAGPRSSGNPVDVKDAAIDIVEQMGIMAPLRAAASPVDRLRFVDTAGHTRSGTGMQAFQGPAGDREVREIARADLAAILLAAARDHAEMRWGDSISGLRQHGDGVDVAFESGDARRFDLVVGADGLHSTVRRLVFGPENRFVRHLGMYVATVPVDRPVTDDREVVMYNAPGRALSVHPAGGKPVAAFMFRQPITAEFDHHDLDQAKRLVETVYNGELGLFSHYRDQLGAADDFFFDTVSRVALPQWSTGRVTLVGDAASSLSLFGDGSTLAIIGAHTLAAELSASPGALSDALHRYEHRHRRVVRPKQRGFTLAAMLLVPKTRTGLATRDLAVRTLDRRGARAPGTAPTNAR